MQKKKLYIISSIFLVIILCLISFDFFRFCIKIFPFIFFISPLFYIKKIVDYFKSNKKKKTLHSESIFQKRIKRFKSIKRGYYSLIILGVLYIASLIGPLWMNNKPLIVHFSNNTYDIGEEFNDINNNGKYDYGESFIDETNGKYDIGEEFNDLNNNGKYDEIADKDIERFKFYKDNDLLISKADGYWDEKTLFYAESLQKRGIKGNKLEIETYNDTANGKYDIGEEFNDLNNNGKYDEIGESFIDEKKYYFPAVRDFFSFIPGIKEARYGADTFNQKTGSAIADFRLLDQELKNDTTNYIIMPFYKYHPHEDLSDQLDESFTDTNNNGKWDIGESFIDENSNNKYDTYNPPTKPGESLRHIAGTESSGRDVFARLVDGYKISITFAIIVSTLGYIIGIMIGACLGYFGGRLDLFGVRLIEIFSSVPFLFVLMILAGFMKPGIFLLAFLSVILKGWIGITMYIRGEFFREKPKDYVSAAVSMGQSNWKIMFKHILPNSLTPIITFAPFAIISDIFVLVSLDFLGYGLQPPASSWGALLKQGAENLDNYHLLIFPVIALTLTIFMITFISEAIREAFDPRVYSRLR